MYLPLLGYRRCVQSHVLSLCARPYIQGRHFKSPRTRWARGPPRGRKAVRAERRPTNSYRRGSDAQVAQQRSLFAGMDDTASVISQARSTKSDSSVSSSLAKLELKMAALGSDISSLGSGMHTLLAQKPTAKKQIFDDDAHESAWDP